MNFKSIKLSIRQEPFNIVPLKMKHLDLLAQVAAKILKDCPEVVEVFSGVNLETENDKQRLQEQVKSGLNSLLMIPRVITTAWEPLRKFLAAVLDVKPEQVDNLEAFEDFPEIVEALISVHNFDKIQTILKNILSRREKGTAAASVNG